MNIIISFLFLSYIEAGRCEGDGDATEVSFFSYSSSAQTRTLVTMTTASYVTILVTLILQVLTIDAKTTTNKREIGKEPSVDNDVPQFWKGRFSRDELPQFWKGRFSDKQ